MLRSHRAIAFPTLSSVKMGTINFCVMIHIEQWSHHIFKSRCSTHLKFSNIDITIAITIGHEA